MTDKPIVHLICTAHLDPIYKWPWEEGAREAISTFHTAADLLDEFPEFVFNHNESLLYEWVETYDPILFERIQHFVAAGRWHISGGWYLQPDLNLPGGETIARCIIEGRRYFSEKFGVRPIVAYNFDSFGHGNGLPQLLKLSGFEMYIHGRPFESILPLPAPLYRWVGVGDASILTLRPKNIWYRTPHDVFTGEVVWAMDQVQIGIQTARKTGQDAVVLWGLGDHGGGPTRDDLTQMRDLINDMRDSDIEVRHSTLEAYLSRIRASSSSVPEYEGEIQRVLAGCYTSMAPTKRKLRQVEAAIASAERWAAVAWWRHGTPYPADELRSAWKRIMLTAFHDVIAGALIENALPGVNDMLGYAGDVVRRIIVSRQHSLLPAVAPEPDTIPLYVLNPHPHPVKAHVGGNFLRTYATALDPGPFNLYAADGQRVAHQEQGGSPVLEGKEMQPYIGFVAEVPALSARRYLVRFETPAASGDDPFVITENAEGIVVESHRWTATFDAATGTLAQLTDHTTGRQLLTDPAEVQAMDDVATAWGGMTREIFSQQVGQFSPLSPAEIGRFVGEADNHQGRAVRVIHRGPVSITVECLTIWELTQAQVQYTFYAQLSHIDVNVRLFMQARQKMIKFVLPFDLPDVQVTCETPYGCTSRATDETEHSYSRWLRMDSPGISVGVTNNGQNGFHLGPSGKLGLSLTRGAVYAAWEDEVPLNPNRSYTFMDQETVDTRFRIAIGETSEQTTQQLIPLALELNQPLEFFFAYHTPTRPDNTPQPPAPFLQIEPNTIALGALKKADQGDALIVRLYESAGQKTTAHLSLDGDERQTVDFNPHEIKTWRITQTDDGVIWEPCNLLEEAIHPQSS